MSENTVDKSIEVAIEDHSMQKNTHFWELRRHFRGTVVLPTIRSIAHSFNKSFSRDMRKAVKKKRNTICSSTTSLRIATNMVRYTFCGFCEIYRWQENSIFLLRRPATGKTNGVWAQEFCDRNSIQIVSDVGLSAYLHWRGRLLVTTAYRW